MPTIKYKPTTNGRRNMTVPSFEELTKFTPEKSLITIKKKNAGRNSYGRITVRHRGGGNKQKYRIIDFKRLENRALRSSALSTILTEPRTSRFFRMMQARRATSLLR